jgi:alcohol dehydrogenase class IV
MRDFGSSAHKRLAELADVCGIEGRNEAEKANAFIRWIEETNEKMGLPDGFDVIKTEDIPQMITWAKREANPLYPVPVIWSRHDFLRVIEAIRKK